MKVYNISFDVTSITIILDDDQDLLDFILQSGDDFYDLYVDGGKLYNWRNSKRWTPNYSEECVITDLTDTRGIIHFESH
jgi:hypothetical protein